MYIDDIIIHSTSIKEHLNSLDIVIDRLTQPGLKLKPSKCFLFKEKANFLGHTISKGGIQKDPSKVEAIKSWKQYTTVKELQRLHQHNKKLEQTNWKWGKEQKHAMPSLH